MKRSTGVLTVLFLFILVGIGMLLVVRGSQGETNLVVEVTQQPSRVPTMTVFPTLTPPQGLDATLTAHALIPTAVTTPVDLSQQPCETDMPPNFRKMIRCQE